MTPTAWGQVEKNAIIWAIGFLALLGVIAAALPVISRIFPFFPFGDALWWVLYGLAFLVFPGFWLYGRAAAGGILFDCGRHPMWILFLVNAALFLIMGLEDRLAAASVSKRSAILWPGVWVWVGACYLVMATGRLQVRANGIWRYSRLLRWGKIGSYDWANDSTLVVRPKRPDPWFPGVLTVPPEHRQVVAELLARHCSAQPTA